jgi:hypothetical protein
MLIQVYFLKSYLVAQTKQMWFFLKNSSQTFTILETWLSDYDVEFALQMLNETAAIDGKRGSKIIYRS